MEKYLDTPVLFLIFNRPEETKRVFETIRKAKPKQLFVAADGPRTKLPEDIECCRKAKEIAIGVDWNCDLKTLFRVENRGCGQAVSEAITWFFQNVEEGIILEDDCICDESFFHFASQLLEKYRTNYNIMHIGAHGPSANFIADSNYSFIKYPLVWGWATWRRAWDHYDYQMIKWPINGKDILKLHYPKEKGMRTYWDKIYTTVFNKQVDTWDYQWAFACMKNQGLSIFPHTNLVKNIGFNVNATHTVDRNHTRANMRISHFKMPINHPNAISLNISADRLVEHYVFELDSNGPSIVKTNLLEYVKNKFRKIKKIVVRSAY
jgi:hypothetical protein